MPVKVSTQAVTESIERLASMDLIPASVSALEAYVVAKRLAVEKLTPSIATVNKIVDEVFVLFPENIEKGRISFGAAEHDGTAVLKWRTVTDSGRGTVWNTSTRNDTKARDLFQERDIRNGLRADAAQILAESLKTQGSAVRPSQQALAVFLVRDALFDTDPDEASVMAKLGELFGITTDDLTQFANNEPLTKPIAGEPQWNPDLLPDALKPEIPHVASTRGSAEVISSAEVVVNERVLRMVRLAIQSSSAVMLVGPPGTGKTTLLRQVVDEIIEDPAVFGFEHPIVLEPMQVTPDESWTALELVGGKTVDEKGRLRFRPGFLLDAIRQDRWLILDEANRADMDKIFGPLLTWLSDQPVELGRATTGIDSPMIELDWNSGPGCEVDPAALAQLEADKPEGERIQFLAGKEWRLLGTYNALDAQRVFRFGQALGRRFARVPIPCPSPAEFRRALEPAAKGLPEKLLSQIESLYSAHFEDAITMLGPAIFLRIPSYVQAGLGTEVDDVDPTDVNEDAATSTGTLRVDLDPGDADEGQGITASAGSDQNESVTTKSTTEKGIQSLLAEGYLINAGTWVATLDVGLLDSLGQRIIDSEALPKEQWLWVKTMLPSLG